MMMSCTGRATKIVSKGHLAFLEICFPEKFYRRLFLWFLTILLSERVLRIIIPKMGINICAGYFAKKPFSHHCIRDCPIIFPIRGSIVSGNTVLDKMPIFFSFPFSDNLTKMKKKTFSKNSLKRWAKVNGKSWNNTLNCKSLKGNLFFFSCWKVTENHAIV